MSAGRAWYVAAGVLGAAALGLPWTGSLAGAGHPARVAVAGAVLLAAAGLRTGRDLLVAAAVGVGSVGVLIGGLDPTPGRLALAGAVVCLVLGARVSGRRLLPGSSG